MATTLVASTMTMNSKIAVHAHPAWRDKANFMIFADLSESGLSGRWEQLWSRQLSETEFQLCCIPFFTYGLALGDRVTTDRKSTRLNSSHVAISYAVFCLK